MRNEQRLLASDLVFVDSIEAIARLSGELDAARADLEVTDSQGRTPLIRAALYGHAPVVARLAKAGATPDALANAAASSAATTAASLKRPIEVMSARTALLS